MRQVGGGGLPRGALVEVDARDLRLGPRAGRCAGLHGSTRSVLDRHLVLVVQAHTGATRQQARQAQNPQPLSTDTFRFHSSFPFLQRPYGPHTGSRTSAVVDTRRALILPSSVVVINTS